MSFLEILGDPGSLYLNMTLKKPPGTKIFDVNIFFLKVETLRAKKNHQKLTVTGGTLEATLAHGLPGICWNFPRICLDLPRSAGIS